MTKIATEIAMIFLGMLLEHVWVTFTECVVR